MSAASSRPSLPTASSDFALPPSSSVNPASSSSSLSLDEINPLMHRFRRPSLLAPKASYLSESRSHSPLAASFTLPSSRRRRSRHWIGDDSESERDRMWTDSSPSSSSENPTPPLRPRSEGGELEEARREAKEILKRPFTPPCHSSSNSMDIQESSSRRRLSISLKTPRIRNLQAESRPEEIEVRSEAAFQRLIASRSELPMHPRTPRNISDRGRYPEEAGQEELQREETPSDDGDEGDGSFAYFPSNSEPINIPKTITPANSVNGDDMSILESPGVGAMDVDMQFGSPMSSTPANHWRYTPPPTTSAVRSSKRKFDDRYDPYPTASKRRAVSPSISYLRESHPCLTMHTPRTTISGSRVPMPIPISIPNSATSSAASSPTISSSYPGSTHVRSMSISSSPILRPSMGLASPILRPVPKHPRRSEGEEREIEGTGDAVGGLSLGA